MGISSDAEYEQVSARAAYLITAPEGSVEEDEFFLLLGLLAKYQENHPEKFGVGAGHE